MAWDVEVEEIEMTVDEVDSVKAPDIGGFPASFNQVWGTLLSMMCAGKFKMCLKQKLQKEANQTLVMLIPKEGKIDNVRQFRPIALCNFLYKIVSKILTNIIREDLSEL